MKITITTTGKKIEKANYVLSEMIDLLNKHSDYRIGLDLSMSDVEGLEIFRKQLLRGYFAEFAINKKR